MSISFTTYHVQRGDTLESISEKFGISAEILKRYHNTYCNLKDLIGTDLRGVQELIIPPQERISEFKEIEKKVSVSNHLPSFYLNQNFYADSYEVIERIERSGNDLIEVGYLLDIQSYVLKDQGFVFEVKTSEFKKQEGLPDDKISMLSLACMEAVSPVTFTVPAQGGIRGIYDHKVLVKKFENKRPDLDDFFVGEINRNYLDKFESNLKNEDYLFQQFCSSLFYQTLFPKMEWLRKREEWVEKFYVIPNTFSVQCHFHTEYDLDNADEVEIFIKGIICEDCSLQELLKGRRYQSPSGDSIQGTIELRYTTSKNSRKLNGLEANISLLHQDEFYFKHNLKLTEKKKI